MKQIMIASLDQKKVDYVCVSDPDGGDIETFASARLLDHPDGQWVKKHVYRMHRLASDDELKELVPKYSIGLIRVNNGSIDFAPE